MTAAVVTGSSGLIGAPLVRALRSAGFDVRGVDARPSATTDVIGDLTRAGAWEADVAAADVVVHTAALVGERGAARTFWDVNVGGTRAVLAAATGWVVHVSSIVVHGSSFPDGVDESAPVHPTGNPYTDTKIASEHLALLAAAAGRPVAVVRPGDVYGPGSDGWTVRPVQLLRSGRLAVPSAGVLSPVFLDDVVEGIAAAAVRDEAVGQVVHLAGGVGVPTREFFGHYARMLGVRLPVVPAPVVAAVAAPVGLLLGSRAPLSRRTLEYITHPGTYSIEKAGRLLDWRPRTSLEEGMARTQVWLREQGLLDR